MKKTRVIRFWAITVLLLAVPISNAVLWGQELSKEGQETYIRAMTYFQKGDFDRAIAEANQVIQLAPHNFRGYLVRGAAYIDKGEYDRAIADLTQVIHWEPTLDADIYNQRGYAYFMKKDYDSAIADFEACLRFNPNDLSAKQWIDAARQARGR